MNNIFTKHPHSVGETYWQHCQFALLFGMNMLIGGVACILHAIFPFIFQKTGSTLMLKSMQRFIERAPVIDESVIMLSEYIEKKRHTIKRA